MRQVWKVTFLFALHTEWIQCDSCCEGEKGSAEQQTQPRFLCAGGEPPKRVLLQLAAVLCGKEFGFGGTRFMAEPTYV